jgi:hypothetical protein
LNFEPAFLEKRILASRIIELILRGTRGLGCPMLAGGGYLPHQTKEADYVKWN